MDSTSSLAERFAHPEFLTSFTHELATYLPARRWFTSKGKKLERTEVTHVLPVAEAAIVVIRNTYADGATERYQMPLAQLAGPTEQLNYLRDFSGMAVFQVPGGPLIVDAVPLPQFRSALYRMIRNGEDGSNGLKCDTGKLLRTAPAAAPSVVPAIDTSNTAIVYADSYFFKLFRKLDEGLNPDLELVRYLSEHAGFAHCPPYAGSIGVGEMHDDGYLNLGMMSGKVDNRGDAWEYFQELTERYFASNDEVDQETLGRAKLLGRRTAEMHRALAKNATDNELLRPTLMTPEYRAEITAAAQKLLNRQMAELAGKAGELGGETGDLAKRVLALKDTFNDKLEALANEPMDLNLIRLHGDYHLGQVLVTEDDFYIIDFEGEPLLSIPERRRKRPALKDVAGMVRSFHYAAHGQLLLNDRYGAEDRFRLRSRANDWYEAVAKAFLQAYFDNSGNASFLPDNENDRQLLLDLFVLEKAVYEVAYELNSRPDWLPIPLNGLLQTAE
ncbi:phosphotransferase [Lewinella sp. 4G2]|uniref:phosphotransferase n=1 Tax=Lewinella sp. 4G2 TaxID=1803372 RepID=UPI0007B48D8B|nr:phosphotransferase [Lewinella sp. 4G2]OAV45642.1 hypothetical protein A3850_014570 [Lewinella sp. 4G2]